MAHSVEGAERVHISARWIFYSFYIALGRERLVAWGSSGWCIAGGTHTVEDWTECAQTHTPTGRRTKMKTVYPPVSLRSLGGYNNATLSSYYASYSLLLEAQLAVDVQGTAPISW